MSEQSSTQPTEQTRLVLRAVLKTDVGLVRSENQDSGTFTTPREEQRSQARGRLLIVADGMGGHRGGATASKLAVQTVKAQYLGAVTDDVPHALREALARANSRIFREAQTNPDLRGMGTTTSALAVRGAEAWIAHVGDSRIYRVRGESIEQLTQDHSLVATMVREGLLTSQEAETHPRRNVLQRSMGVGEEVEIDVFGPLDVQEGDTFVLCSDGLHGVVKEHEILEVAQGPIEQAAAEFVRRALERGAPDNVTVIVARAETTSEPEEMFDDGLDETQPLDPIDLADLDDTARDTERLPSLRPDELGKEDTDPRLPVAGEGTPPAAPDAGEATPGTEEQRPPAGSSLLKWTLVLMLALGAAGAWLYWTQPSNGLMREARQSRSSSR
jgi:protein phosphatase